MTPSQRLDQMNLTLPPVAEPVGAYRPAVRSGQLVFVSGQLPIRDGKLLHTGSLGEDLTPAMGVEAARLAALNAVAAAADAANGIDQIARIVRVGVFVNSAEGFVKQSQVANGASDLLHEVFGEAGVHARAAVGAAELPMDAPVEVELIVELR